MVSLYAMLFDSEEFDGEDGLTFDWNPIFWGMGPETFKYSRKSLQNTIIEQMEREKWLGVCCEPNNIFIVCNQFPVRISPSTMRLLLRPLADRDALQRHP